MKQNYLKSFCARFLTLLVLALMSTNLAWGEVSSPITLVTNKTNVGYTSGIMECKDAFDYKLTFTSVSGGGTNYVQNAKNSSIYNTIAVPGTITSIKLTDCATTSTKTDGSFKVFGGTSSDGCTNQMGEVTGLSSTAADKEVEFSGDYTFFKITVGADRVLKISSIIISFSTGKTTSISANNVDLEADATSGEISYTISNPVEGKNLTAETSTEWISNVTVDAANSKVTFNTTANAGAQRKGTITLKYEGAKDKVVTITQNKPIPTYASLADLVDAGKPTATDVIVKVTLTNVKIYEKSSSYIVVKTADDAQAVKIYKSGCPSSWEVNGTVSGTITCPWCLYNSKDWELKINKWDDLTYTAPVYHVTGVSLKESTTLVIGGTETLTATITPDNATDKSVSWSSDKPEIATVDENGLVTAVAAGTATITVTTTDGGKTATCNVTVNKIKLGTPTGLMVSESTPTSATLTWDAVENATGYEVYIFGENYENTESTNNNSIVFSGLTENTSYMWSVKAKGDNITYSDGDANENGEFTTPSNTKFIVSFNGNGADGEMEQVEAYQGEYTLPACTFTYENKVFKGWKVNNEGELLEAGSVYNLQSAITLYAQWNDLYTITFMNVGEQFGDAIKVEAGNAIGELPTVTEDIGVFKFQGWAAQIDGKVQEAPAYITAETVPTASTTYYAVYAKEEVGVDSWIAVNSLSDLSTSDKFVFAAGGYAMSNAICTSGGPSAVEITVVNNIITKVGTDEKEMTANDVAWTYTGDATNGYTFHAANSNPDRWLYSSTTSESSNNTNIRVGSPTSGTNRNVWDFDDDKQILSTKDNYTTRYLSMYSDQNWRGYVNTNTGSLALSFYKFTAGEVVVSDYCTTVPRTFAKTISNRKMATLYLDYAVEIPTGVKAYTAADKDDSHTAITLEKITDGVIPANTGVIVYADVEANTSFDFVETATTKTYNSNCLKGVTEKTAFDAVADYDDTNNNYYALMADGETSVVFKLVSGGSYAANSAYLVLPKTANAKVDFTFDDEPTGIKTIDNGQLTIDNSKAYNLNGVRVKDNYKGIVIMNGKKYINK